MSEGLHNVAGADGEIILGERVYRTSKLRLRHKAEMEAHILAHRPDLIGEAAKSVHGLPEELRDLYGKEFIAAAIRQMEQRKSVSREEFNAYCDTFDGVCYAIWQMVRDHHPELAKSYELVRPLCEGIEIEVLQHKVDQASGDAALKNSVGRIVPTNPAEATAPLGPSSTDTLPVNSAGRPTSLTN